MTRAKITPFISLTFLLIPLFVLASQVFGADDEAYGWKFQLAGYGWLSGQKGTVSTFPNMPETDINIDFWDDIKDNINGALYMVGEARKGSFGAVFDLAYSDIELKEKTPGPYFSALSSRTKTWMVTGGGYYRLLENSRSFLDLMAGLRYWSLESKLELKTGMIQGGDITNTKTWIDPVVGGKGLIPMGDSDFFISGAMLFGGFTAGSDFMWDAMANLGYNWTKNIATTLGYRYLKVDYDNDSFVYDVEQHGPTLALLWRF